MSQVLLPCRGIRNLESLNKIVIFLFSIVCFAGCLSCERPAKQQLLINDGIVFNRSGRVNYQFPFYYDKEKTVVTYLDNKVVDFVLCDTPKGKIDRIIDDNPDWNFIFVLNAQLEDSLDIVNKLNQYGCDFPVIIDINHQFINRNKLDHVLATTFVYKRDKSINLGVIGSSKSFFDVEFERYKKELK